MADLDIPPPRYWGDEVMAVTLALVEGNRLSFVLETLGAAAETKRTATFDEAEVQQLWDGSAVFQVELLDRWTLIVEPNGFLAWQPDNVLALSLGGRVVSVYWNVNGHHRFQYAVDGCMVRDFDPCLPDVCPMGAPLLEETGLMFGLGGILPPADAAVALAQRLTGAQIDLAMVKSRGLSTWTVHSPW